MQSFIVLGIIPGTNIQTTLNFWITVSILLAVLILRGPLVAASNLLRLHVGMRQIAHTIRRYEFNAVS